MGSIQLKWRRDPGTRKGLIAVANSLNNTFWIRRGHDNNHELVLNGEHVAFGATESELKSLAQEYC